jgi:hypothetical protein
LEVAAQGVLRAGRLGKSTANVIPIIDHVNGCCILSAAQQDHSGIVFLRAFATKFLDGFHEPREVAIVRGREFREAPAAELLVLSIQRFRDPVGIEQPAEISCRPVLTGLYWAGHCDAVAFPSPVSAGVTLGTERDEIQLGIFARMAAQFLMVNLQVRHRAAGLTPPAVAT